VLQKSENGSKGNSINTVSAVRINKYFMMKQNTAANRKVKLALYDNS